MMTFKDLKKLVELPSYKEQRVPTVKALEVSGVPVVTEKVLENHGSIKVYQNGYVIYRAHKRVTVFSLRDCVHYKYLADLNEQATERCSLIIEQMKQAEGVTETMKADNQMLWVQSMNSIRNRAEEIIRQEMIYC